MYNNNAYEQERSIASWPRQAVDFARQWLAADSFAKRRLVFTMALAAALVAFELFNFSTTELALSNLLGGVQLMGLQWATLLAIALCAIDFTGLVRLFTPNETGNRTTMETWYVLGAWFLAATLNAIMTWWAVSLVMMQTVAGNEILSRLELLTYVPIAIAALVWLTRMFLIGTFSMAGERLFGNAATLFNQLRSGNYTISPLPSKSLPRQRVASTGVRRLNPRYILPQSAPAELPEPQVHPAALPYHQPMPQMPQAMPRTAPMPRPVAAPREFVHVQAQQQPRPQQRTAPQQSKANNRPAPGPRTQAPRSQPRVQPKPSYTPQPAPMPHPEPEMSELQYEPIDEFMQASYNNNPVSRQRPAPNQTQPANHYRNEDYR